MAIKITEDGAVRYVNENDIDRTLFPNLTGAIGDEQYDALNGRLTVVEGSVSDLQVCCESVNNDISELNNNLNQKADKYEALSAFVVETATGSIASFSDGADDVPVKDLTVAIEPVQSGSGDPSPENIRYISGWTGANVYHRGEDTSDYDTLSISWETEAGTVYGGTLDVTTGVLTVTMVEVDISTLDYTPSTPASHVFRTDSLRGLIEPPLTNAQTANAICSSFSQIGYSPISASSNGKFAVANKGDSVEGRLIFVDHRYSTIEAFISGNEGTQLVYELATPQTYQLTPQEVNTILGQNNIFAGTGDVTVQYRADTKLYIDKVLSQA